MPTPRRLRLLLAATCLAAAALPARGLGPMAPFVPPGGDAAALLGGPPPAGGADTSVGLSGVRLGPHPGALIDGTWVPQGGQVRGARLEAVTRRQAVLRHADGHAEILELFPATAAPAASTAAPAASAASTAHAER